MDFEDKGQGIEEDLHKQVVEFLKSFLPSWYSWQVFIYAPGEDDSGLEAQDKVAIERYFETTIDSGTTGWRVKFWSREFAKARKPESLSIEDLMSPWLPTPTPIDIMPACLFVMPLDYDRDLNITEEFKSTLKAHINEHTGLDESR